MAKKPYHEMTDDEITAAVKEICGQCEKLETDGKANKEVERMILKELDCEGPIAVTCTSTRHGPFVMRMFMVMIYGPRGNVIHI